MLQTLQRPRKCIDIILQDKHTRIYQFITNNNASIQMCDKKKIWSPIKKSQNNINMIVAKFQQEIF